MVRLGMMQNNKALNDKKGLAEWDEILFSQPFPFVFL
jgi:hypothetical protein